jgi:photosystem II stability/assembly factor-like uncharacterized protein
VRAIFLAAATGATLLSVAVPAAANGRFPASNQIVFSPTDPNLVVLRTSYGVLPSHDHGTTWQYICEDALGLGPTAVEDPSLGLTTHNTLIAGVSVGLDVSSDLGCNWTCESGSLAGQSMADIAVRPDNTLSAVALTKTFMSTDSGVDIASSQVFETNDEGVTWTAIGTPIDPTVTVQTIDVAKGDPNRIYISGTRGFGSATTASLFVSTDKGATWSEKMLPAANFDPSNEASIFIGAVDPNDEDRVYVRSTGLITGGESRLTVVTGASTASPQFQTAHLFNVAQKQMGVVGELLGFALSEDGSKIFIGTEESGLWEGSASDLTSFHALQPNLIVQCLATHGNELWVCSAAVSGFVAGVSTDDGATFTPKLSLIGNLTGPIACADNPQGAACGTSTNSSQCVAAYQTFCEVNVCATGTTGLGKPADAGAGSSGSGTGSGSSSSSCSVPVGRGSLVNGGAACVLGGLGLFAFGARRRRSKAPSGASSTEHR